VNKNKVKSKPLTCGAINLEPNQLLSVTDRLFCVVNYLFFLPVFFARVEFLWEHEIFNKSLNITLYDAFAHPLSVKH